MTDPVAIAIATSAAAVLTSGIAAYFSYKTKVATKEVHGLINSRMTELLEITRSASKAEGKVEEKAEAKARVVSDPGPN